MMSPNGDMCQIWIEQLDPVFTVSGRIVGRLCKSPCRNIIESVILCDGNQLSWLDYTYSNRSIVRLVDNNITRKKCPEREFVLEP